MGNTWTYRFLFWRWHFFFLISKLFLYLTDMVIQDLSSTSLFACISLKSQTQTAPSDRNSNDLQLSEKEWDTKVDPTTCIWVCLDSESDFYLPAWERSCQHLYQVNVPSQLQESRSLNGRNRFLEQICCRNFSKKSISSGFCFWHDLLFREAKRLFNCIVKFSWHTNTKG